MAWVTGSGKSTGDLIDAAEWNQTVVANEAILKTAINNAGHVSFVDASELTIASGAVTATQNYHAIDTESDAGSDDLDTITAGASVVAGHVLALFAAHTARTVVLKDGTGNLNIDGSDITLSSDEQAAVLVFDGTNWRAVARPSAAASFAGLSPLSTRGDTLVASSGVVTGTRLAIGAANTVLTSDGTDAAWAAPGGATVGYTATLADVANTTTETTMIQFTVPANKMADGDMIQIWFHALLKNNKGSAGTVTLSVDWGATSSANFATANQNDNATEREVIKSVVMIRSGTDLIFTDQSAADKGPYLLFGYGSWTYADFTVKATSVDFTVNSTVAIRAKLSAAHATFYLKPQTASCIKYEGDA